MNYKDSKDYPQLIELLKSRGLIIENEKEAECFLQRVHYYRLSSYFIPFQYPKDTEQRDIFKEKLSFEDISSLYLFDEALRKMTFDYLSELEIILRVQISHIHTQQYGPFGYIRQNSSLKRELKIKGRNLFDDLITQINKQKARAKEDFIRHIKEKYKIDDLPLWALVEILSFGALSKFFELMQKEEQLKLMSFFDLGAIPINIFQNWVESLSYVRNLCVHHSRIWNRQFVKKFKHNKEILNDEAPTDKVFFALSVLAKILNDKKIKEDFTALLEQYPKTYTKAMGVPQNWHDLSPWSKL